MKVRYDREGDTLDMLLEDRQIHHAEEYGQVIVNYDEKGKIVEVELLNASKLLGGAQSKKPVIYQRGDRRVRRVLRLFQQLLGFSGASAFSVCSAVKFKDIAISLKKSTVPLVGF